MFEVKIIDRSAGVLMNLMVIRKMRILLEY